MPNKAMVRIFDLQKPHTAALGFIMNGSRYLISALLFSISVVAMPNPEMKFECDAPKHENYNGVAITIKHCVDSSGPDSDGFYEFYYDYETFVFELEKESVSGKRYSDTQEEASFTRITDLDGERYIESRDFEKELLRSAISYLKARGAETITYLDPSNTFNGYSKIPGL